MVKPRTSSRRPALANARRHFFPVLLALFSFFILSAQAALQFDVFLGYEGIVPEASWFPVVCEIKNDGASFTGVIEISSGRFNESLTRRVVVELPTGTLKRVVIPVFSTARFQSTWDARLVDDHNNVHAEQPNLQPRRQSAASATLVGAIPRTPTGVPVFRTTATRASETELQPIAARLQTSIVPDNPLVLEGMDALYLNSEKATELNDQQISALLAWLHLGGHLILGIEQISDVNATPWLRQLVPCDLTDMRTVQSHPGLQQWLRNSTASATQGAYMKNRLRVASHNSNLNPYADVPEDNAFEKSDLQVVTGRVRDAEVLVAASDTPLILLSHQGRGRITCLMFSPERKPFTTWINLPSFWSKLTGVSTDLYSTESGNNNLADMHGGWSIDGVFGAMIDSKQVRKLPVEWLLLLLIIYLVVIGPLDQYWLKKIKRPMLTWITFPCYVVLFSLLIYFIGYKLRAGETEWNELHVVDVLPSADGAELRGRTYASVYSPVNGNYRVETLQHFSTFRGEFQSSWNGGGGQEGERAEVLQNGDNFMASIFVPVWTSQLYVCDWWQSAELPLKLSVTPNASGWTVVINNLRDHELTNARLVIGDHIVEVGALAAGQAKTIQVANGQGTLLKDFVATTGGNFQTASQSRQRAFGSTGGGRILDLPNSTIAVSFISNLPQERFLTPPGLDLSSLLDQGNAILLAWESDYSPIKPLNQFAARRSDKNTLWRIAVPLNAAP